MKTERKTKAQLIKELEELLRQVEEQEKSETGHKRAEEALRESEMRYRTLASTQDSMYYVDRECRYQFMNGAHLLRLDVSLNEIIGRSYGEFHSGEDTIRFAEKVNAVFETGNALQTEHRSERDNKYFLRTFSPVKDLQGNITGVTVISKDITERKQMEEALKESEERYKALFDHSLDCVYIHDLEGRILDMNQAALDLLGYTREEISLVNFPKILGHEQMELAFQTLDELRQTGTQNKLTEYKLITKDGGTVFIETKASMIMHNGKPYAAIGIARDITERKQAEKALRETEERFRSVVENAPFGYYRVGKDGLWQYVNPVWEQMHSLSHKEIIGKPFEITQPEDFVEQAREYVKRALAGETIVGEFGRLTRKGNIEYHSFNIQPVKHDKEIVAIEGFINDITERKKAEELIRKNESLLKEAQHVAHIGHWELDNVVGTPKWSEEIFHIFGLDPAQSEPSFKAHQKIIHPDDWDILNDAVTKASIEGIPFDIEFRLLRPDASIRWMNAKGNITRDGEGRIVRIFGTAQDITVRKRTEEEVRASREQLRALAGRLQAVHEEARTNMARQIHDELGGALTGLKIDFSLLTRAALKIENETVRTSLLADMDSIIESINSTIHTVRRIAMELRPGVLDDLDLLAALEWQLKDFEKRNDIRCEFFPPEEEIALDADLSTALFRIFQEALTNVTRHSGATEVRVRLHADADGSVLEVEDNGKGIEEEKILSSKSLGLLGMRERAQMLGGRTTITGTPGKGTKVMVEVPLWEKRKMDRDQKGATR